MKFELLNVFTIDHAGGNQLAVVYPKAQLTHESMLKLAQDFGFSETVYIYPDHKLSIYTPVTELPFAGHPTIGAAWSIAQGGSASFTMQSLKGPILASGSEALAQVRFPGEVSIVPSLIHPAQIMTECELSTTPPEKLFELNSGPHFLLIDVDSLADLKKAKPVKSLQNLARPYLVFREDQEHFHVRMFSPYLKGGEDAATGSAACALAGYLRQIKKEKTGKATIFQGAELGRPSQIEIEWNEDQIELKGQVHRWGQGDLAN